MNKKIAVIIGILIFIFSCDTENKDPDPAPEIPPVESFVIDFSDFQNKKDIDLTAFNWFHAAANVAVWNIVLTVNLVIPVAAFVESFNHEGIWDSELNGWIWTYDFYAGGIKHTAELEATLSASDVNWEMYITKEGSFERFLWYSGESNHERTQGTWDLNYNPTDPQNYLDIEWNYNHTDSIGNIKYSIVKTDAENNGSYIFYGTSSDETYDAFYDILLTNESRFTEIEWNRLSKEGRVKDSIRFQDNNWHCWDANLQDIDCQ